MRREINREILKLAVPSILANITVPLVGMVDIAVAGHLTGGAGGSAALIGGIAIGSMLFDLLYWNFAFLRVSTGGMTAQAYGRWDAALKTFDSQQDLVGTDAAEAAKTAAEARSECARNLLRSLSVALASALVLIAIQWLFVQAAFCIVKCTPEVRELAQQYFYIRIWASPATLCLMAFKGWYIGMQDSVTTMSLDLVVNVVNIVGSIVLSLGFVGLSLHGIGTTGASAWHGLGFKGVALGTVVAQYSGLAVAVLVLVFKYGKKIFAGTKIKVQEIFGGEATRKFFSMNGDISVRSLCFIAIYIGYTLISARFGDTLLAVCSIMMKIFMVFSYFIDGFAYAGEAMTGKYIGAQDRKRARASIKWNMVWCVGMAVMFMFVYGFGGNLFLRLMTSDPVVVDAAREFLPWLLLMPVAGCAAFAFDGIYVGATEARSVRNAMLLSALSFYAVWFAGIWFFNPNICIAGLHPTSETAIHLLMAAYLAHLFARAIYLSVSLPKSILRKYC